MGERDLNLARRWRGVGKKKGPNQSTSESNHQIKSNINGRQLFYEREREDGIVRVSGGRHC